jgi:cell division protein FtsB
MVVTAKNNSLKRELVFVTLALAMIAYFASHAYSGKYGVHANRAFELELATLRDELQAAVSERKKLESRVALLQPASLDRDLLEERARTSLGFVHPNDVVIFLNAPAKPTAAKH